MPEVIDCPSCGRRLRRPANAVGQLVQCPTCAATFLAAVPAEEMPPVLAIPVDVVPLGVDPASANEDRPLQLSLGDEPPRPVQGLPPPPQPLVPIPVEPLPASRQTASPCPRCGNALPRKDPHCPRCGWEPEGENRTGPAFDRYQPRRDLEPHRGGLVLTLGVLSVRLLPFCVLCPVSFVLGLAAWIMGRHDLEKMEANVMDPAGMANTRGGRVCGILGTLAGGAVTLLCVLGWLR